MREVKAIGGVCCCGAPQVDATRGPRLLSADSVRITMDEPRMTHAAVVQRKMAMIGRMFLLISLCTIGATCGGRTTELRKNHGIAGGGTRLFAACSKAYAKRSSVGSLHAIPVKLTPNGAGLALKFSGKAGVGAFGTVPNGTMTVG